MIVNKFGTEAAASTVPTVSQWSAIVDAEPIPFNVNRSFYVAIVYHESSDDSTPLPLFTGVVNKVWTRVQERRLRILQTRKEKK